MGNLFFLSGPNRGKGEKHRVATGYPPKPMTHIARATRAPFGVDLASHGGRQGRSDTGAAASAILFLLGGVALEKAALSSEGCAVQAVVECCLLV